jgi:RNA polymerase sigma factor (sigma-70 family)
VGKFLEARVDATADTVAQFVASAQGGSAEAFAALIRRFERVALSVAMGVIGEASAAGDVVQEAFLRAWQRLGELQDANRFGAWLCGIVRNLATDHFRRRQAQARHVRESLSPVAPPTQRIERDETRQLIDAAMASLDEVSRSAVMLRYYEGQSSREIAALLNLTPAAVDMRLSRARQALREKLEPLQIHMTD